MADRRPRLLDLFCCEGGAGTGYHQAGFDIVGVDINPQPRYPFEFVQGDALEYWAEHRDQFDAWHASPPCQSESSLRHRTGKDYLDLLTPTFIAFTLDGSRPWVIENVQGAGRIPGALILCGSEFGLSTLSKAGERRHLKRHRRFWSNVDLWGAGGCSCKGLKIGGIYGDGGGGQQTRGWRYESADQMREVMGMPWASRKGLSQAIPPAYTRHLGEQLAAQIRRENFLKRARSTKKFTGGGPKVRRIGGQ